MKKILLALFISCLGNISFAQESADLSTIGCATVTTPAEIQRIYDFNQLPPAAFKPTAGRDTIPLTIHIVGKDDGSGYYSLDNLFQVICDLNTRYAPVNMYFYIKWPVNFINNTSYYVHNNLTGAQMMYQNNVANTVNVYFVDDPSGACGYFSPSADAVAIAKKCSAPASTTLVHELGHYFGLPHTFFGWESGNTPSPSDQERVARTNCGTAGDGFCDTPADYLGDRWYCPYNGTKLDLDGAPYNPDPTIYMSYSTDACMTRFTSQQIAYMKNRLHNSRSYLLSRAINKPSPYASLADAPQIVYPQDLLYSNFQKVIWKKVPGAEYYHVKVLRNNVFVMQEGLTSDTTFTLTFNIIPNYNFSVKVDPLMGSNVCKPNSSTAHSFVSTSETTTMSVGNTVSGGDGSVRLIPNPATGGSVEVRIESLPFGKYQLQLVNMSGQKVLNYALDHNQAASSTRIATGNLPSGMYFVQVKGQDGSRWMEKLLIQH